MLHGKLSSLLKKNVPGAKEQDPREIASVVVKAIDWGAQSGYLGPDDSLVALSM
jgi:hypothetical protein